MTISLSYSLPLATYVPLPNPPVGALTGLTGVHLPALPRSLGRGGGVGAGGGSCALKDGRNSFEGNEGWHMVPGVPAVAVSAPGGSLSTKGFSTVRVPPRKAL